MKQNTIQTDTQGNELNPVLCTVCQEIKLDALKICDNLRNGLLFNYEPKSLKRIAIQICCEYQKYPFMGSFNYWEEVKKEIKRMNISRYSK